MAEEFGESTNAIRHELNNLSKAGYLVAHEQGRTIQYSANTDHPLFPELKNLIHKYLGIDKIVDNILSKIGELYMAFIVGDYAMGKDSGVIDLVLVGNVNEVVLKSYVAKAEKLIKRKIKTQLISLETFEKSKKTLKPETALWLWRDIR
jgi:hypothetical protein